MEEFVQLNKDDILRIGIKTCDGEIIKDEKGKDIFLEFDMADIELPLKLNNCESEHRKNVNYVKMQMQVIDKKEDKKGKFILSSNEEEKIKLIKEFYLREMGALDLFLGEGGTRKLLNGRNPYWDMYDDISKIIEPILPLLKQSLDNVGNRVKEKYKIKEENNILK